ncbi:IS110 family transposase [Roseicella frigidaeris]|uniref:IS110 family transposase n=1 Tax=Roseicella frigidaeris TaxID=2230885 RepID=UPI001403696E|nr:IS110 family transposase [Roseicella frigidaeris]
MNEANPHDIIVGIDTHKHTHAAVAITGLGARVGELTIRVGLGGYRELEAWAQSLGASRLRLWHRGHGLVRRRPGALSPRGGPSRSRAAPLAWQDGPP